MGSVGGTVCGFKIEKLLLYLDHIHYMQQLQILLTLLTLLYPA